jgi:hypothetical protein
MLNDFNRRIASARMSNGRNSFLCNGMGMNFWIVAPKNKKCVSNR